MKKIVYFILLILFVLFSWLYKEPENSSTSGQEKSYQITIIN